MTTLKLALGGIALVAIGTATEARAQAPDDDEGEVSCPAPGNGCPQTPPTPVTQPVPPPVPVPERYHHVTWYEQLGYSIGIGGGATDFVGSTMRATTGVGGSWNVRLTGGTHSWAGFEVAYIGSAQSIQRIGLASSSTLVGNGVQGDLRLNGTVDFPIQPFVYGGVAYRYYTLSTSAVNTSDIANNNNVLEVPVGGGIAAYVDPNIALDVRGEYRFAWGQQGIILDSTGNTALLDTWGVMGNIAYAF